MRERQGQTNTHKMNSKTKCDKDEVPLRPQYQTTLEQDQARAESLSLSGFRADGRTNEKRNEFKVIDKKN